SCWQTAIHSFPRHKTLARQAVSRSAFAILRCHAWMPRYDSQMARGESASVLTRGLAAIHKTLSVGFLRASLPVPINRSRTPGSGRAKARVAHCRLHGGASGSGGPPGERNGQYRHGERTKAAITEQRKFGALLKMLRAA